MRTFAEPASRRRYKFLIAVLLFAGVLCADTPEILVNGLLAEKLDLRSGEIVEVASTGDMKDATRFRVAAVYQEKADPYLVPLRRNLIKMHLPDLERVTGRIDELSLVSLQVRKGADASKLAARLNAESIGFTAFSATELMSRTSTTFQVVSRFHRAIAMITMTAGAVFIFALVVMRVEDQRKNLAILTVTGVSKKTILKSLLLESTIFAFIASILGVLIGYVAAAIVNLRYRHFYQTDLIFAEVTPSILLQALCVSFFLGIVSGTFAWFRLRRLAILQELGR